MDDFELFSEKEERGELFFFERGKLIQLFHECLYSNPEIRGDLPINQPIQKFPTLITKISLVRNKRILETSPLRGKLLVRLFPMKRGGVLEPSLKGCHVELPGASECVLPSHDRTLAN